MYVEAATLTLGARLLQKYCDSGECTSAEPTGHSLDHLRLRRVLDYLETNIRQDITLVDLAQIAGYSVFHFARKFTFATGVTPHRYISRMRLERAMAELAADKLSLFGSETFRFRSLTLGMDALGHECTVAVTLGTRLAQSNLRIVSERHALLTPQPRITEMPGLRARGGHG